MVEMLDSEVMTSDALLERARQLRAAARELEALVGLRDPALSSPTDWAAVLHGDWVGQRATAESAAASRHATRHGLAIALTTTAVTAALLGDVPASSAAAARAESVAPDEADVRSGVALARAVVWFARGDAGVAIDTMAEALRGTEASLVGLLAEAAIRTHREEDVRLLVAGAEASDGPAAEEVRLAAALLTDGDAGEAMIALLASGALASPFARARLHLALGMWFRRHRRPTDARRHLQISLDHFTTLGAEPWIGPARNELRATGVRQPGSDDAVLSDQQALIAGMAARGLSNREIAQRLFLSPRTVSSHLYRIFPKLGITSRSQLGAGLARRRAAVASRTGGAEPRR